MVVARRRTCSRGARLLTSSKGIVMKHLASIAAFSSLLALGAADALAAGGPVGMTNPAGRPVGLDHALIRMSPQGLANQQATTHANPAIRPIGPPAAAPILPNTPTVARSTSSGAPSR